MQSQVPITTIIFDLGCVLMDIDFDSFPRLLNLNKDNTTPEMRKEIEKLAVNVEIGKISTEEFYSSLDKIFQHRYSRAQLAHAWDSMIGPEKAEIAPIVEKLRPRYTTAILSNTSEGHFARALEISPLVRSFSHRFLSFEIGFMKPDSRIFEHVIDALKVPPATIVFIDDLEVNVEAAKMAGMNAFVYSTIDQFIEDLSRFNVEIVI